VTDLPKLSQDRKARQRCFLNMRTHHEVGVDVDAKVANAADWVDWNPAD